MSQRRAVTLRRVAVSVLVAPIRPWQLLAPFRTPRCRFAPSCSEYAIESLRIHGVIRGSYLATKRLLRCHPWNPGGIDHVPPVGAIGTKPIHHHDDTSGLRG